MIKVIDKYISFIEPTNQPLSANSYIISGEKNIWLYDVGNNPEWIAKLNNFDRPVNVLLSHFHPDHIGNLDKISYSQLYLGKNTFNYVHAGLIVEKDLFFEDGSVKLHAFPIQSSHAKGSLALEVNDKYLFLGDATYHTRKKEKQVYNAEQLLGMIRTIESTNAEFVLCSHRQNYIQEKIDLLKELKEVYSRRVKNEPYIEVF